MPLPRRSQTELAHEQASNDVHYHHDRVCKDLGALFEALKFLGHNHTDIIGHLTDMLGDITFPDVDQY